IGSEREQVQRLNLVLKRVRPTEPRLRGVGDGAVRVHHGGAVGRRGDDGRWPSQIADRYGVAVERIVGQHGDDHRCCRWGVGGVVVGGEISHYGSSLGGGIGSGSGSNGSIGSGASCSGHSMTVAWNRSRMTRETDTFNPSVGSG